MAYKYTFNKEEFMNSIKEIEQDSNKYILLYNHYYNIIARIDGGKKLNITVNDYFNIAKKVQLVFEDTNISIIFNKWKIYPSKEKVFTPSTKSIIINDSCGLGYIIIKHNSYDFPIKELKNKKFVPPLKCYIYAPYPDRWGKDKKVIGEAIFYEKLNYHKALKIAYDSCWYIKDLKIYDKPKELTEFNLFDCPLTKNGKMMKPVCFTEEL